MHISVYPSIHDRELTKLLFYAQQIAGFITDALMADIG
jgi:hypothetical protein